jgi:hypothetical protein
MPEAMIKVIYDDQTGENLKFTFDEYVTPVYDHCLIADCSQLYLNAGHRADKELISLLLEGAKTRTGFHAEACLITLDQLRAARIPISRTQILRFMAGNPIWHIPTMFTPIEVGTKYVTEAATTLSEAMAIQAAIGRTIIKKALELNYRRLPNRYPEDSWMIRAGKDASEITSDASGVLNQDDENGEPENIPINIKEIRANGQFTGREIEAGKTYVKTSATMVALNAINRAAKSQPGAGGSPYEACIERIKYEINHARNLFGGPLDGAALAAWHHRVITALRMGASAYKYLDAQRRAVSTNLRTQNAEYTNLRTRLDPTVDDINRIQQIKENISRLVEDYRRETPRSLGAIEGERKRRDNVVNECINPLNAAIIAFYGKTNPLIISGGICNELGEVFGATLESLVWLGRLHRERTRTLTPEIASALLATIDGDEINADTRRIVDACMEVGYSFLDVENRTALIEAAQAAAATGESRTVLLALRSAEEPANNGAIDANAGIVADIPDARPEFVNELSSGQHLWARDTDAGSYAAAFPRLTLCGTFLSLPPFYNRDWARRWQIVRNRDDVFERFANR